MAVNALAVAGRLGASSDALAALGALIRIETEGLEADPEVHAALRAIATELLGDPVVDPARDTPILGLAQTFLAQGAELLANPGRAGAWNQVDPQLLQGIGRMSMGIAPAIRIAAEQTPALSDRLAGGAQILDVGTGVGWLAVALARSYPAAQVVGIDIFEPALELARGNVAAEQLQDRIELRGQDVLSLDPAPAYDAVWLALPFLPGGIVPPALAAVHDALKPGGWLIAGTFAPAGPDRLSGLLMDLRTVRSGGHPWTAEDLLPLMAAAGYRETHQVPRSWAAPVHLFLGRRAE